MDTNKVSNQRHRSGNRRGPEPKRRESGGQQESSHGYVGDIAEQASDYMSRGASQFREMTRDHEGTAVLVGLIAGFGVGVLIGSALAGSHHQSPSWRSRTAAAEGVGRRLLDRIEGMIPETVAEYFGK